VLPSRRITSDEGSNGSQDLDDFAVAPYTAIPETLTGAIGGYPQVIVQARTAGAENSAQAEIVTILGSRRQLPLSRSRLSPPQG
jgi:hypothetical protein